MLDDRGATSVIGTILLVAIVVVLAATASVYVLNQPTVREPSPNVAFSVSVNQSASPQELTVTMTGGDALRDEDLYLVTGAAGEFQDNGCRTRSSWEDIPTAPANPVEPGDSFTVSGCNSDERFTDTTIRIVYENPDGENWTLFREDGAVL